MSRPDPRRVAGDVLLGVDEGQWSDDALARALEHSPMADVDRALATRLVYGTLARQRTLDHTIQAYAARPLSRIDPLVLTALRLGLFQMAFLDRVPDHAAVATSVDLVAHHAKSAKGFVNALLRRAQREGLAPPPRSPEAARLGVTHSHPDWLVKMWSEEVDDVEALLAANNEAAPTCYRTLDDRDAALKALSVYGIEAEAGRFATHAIVVPGPVQDLDGLAVVQGEASQLVVEMLDPRPGERVLDACAAPGGKTAAIAARVGPEGRVVACDPANRAGERIRAALGNAGIEVGVSFHAIPVEDLREGTFDAVLADAPCSGLGTLRQHPEIRWRRTPDDLAHLASRQRSILEAVAAMVRPGGRLVYSTCTIARIENDDVVAAFLAAHPEFVREGPGALPAGVGACCDDEGTLRTFPQRHGIDGFFAVRLRKRGDAAS